MVLEQVLVVGVAVEGLPSHYHYPWGWPHYYHNCYYRHYHSLLLLPKD